MYATIRYSVCMRKQVVLKRKSFFIDEKCLKRARRALRVKSDSEAVRLSLAKIAEMAEFWGFMDRTRGAIEPGSFSGR